MRASMRFSHAIWIPFWLAALNCRTDGVDSAPADAAQVRAIPSPLPPPPPPPSPPPSPRVRRAKEPPAPPADPAALNCLERELPHEFHPAQLPQFNDAVHRCIGTTGKEMAASGVTRFRFGRGVLNGRELELSVGCSGQCPENTSFSIVYPNVTSAIECVCIGGRPFGGWEMGPFGCAAVVPHFEGDFDRDFSVRPEPEGGRLAFRVYGGSIGTRLDYLGFIQGTEVISVDGRAVKDIFDVEKVLRGFPKREPGVVKISTGGGGGARLVRHAVHYRSRKVFVSLFDRITALVQSDPSPPRCARSHEKRVGLGGSERIVDDSCHDEATKAWLSLAAEIEKEARSRSIPAPARGTRCQECANLLQPNWIGVEDENELIEVRYVSWLPSPDDAWCGAPAPHDEP